MSTVTLNDQYLSDIADSIRAKLNVATTYLPSEMALAIDSIPTGGGGADYPDWSWVKNDGYTHVIVDIYNDQLYTIKIGIVSFAGTIDWGDGNTQSFSTGSYTQVTHTYTATGVYNISFSAPITFGNAANQIAFGAAQYGYDKRALKYLELVTNNSSLSMTADNYGFSNCPCLELVYYGDNVAYSYCFENCGSLHYVSFNQNLYIPPKCFAYSGIVGFVDRTPSANHYLRCPGVLAPQPFYYATSLSGTLNLHTSITGAGTASNATCQRCSALENVNLVGTKIGSYMFNESRALDTVVVGPDCTNIYANAFATCRMKELHIKATTPPSLSNTNAINMSNITSGKIYVPSASLTAYQAATNWDQFLIYMVGE